jgi:hypothetical protein
MCSLRVQSLRLSSLQLFLNRKKPQYRVHCTRGAASTATQFGLQVLSHLPVLQVSGRHAGKRARNDSAGTALPTALRLRGGSTHATAQPGSKSSAGELRSAGLFELCCIMH